jgi:hypothetical protein
LQQQNQTIHGCLTSIQKLQQRTNCTIHGTVAVVEELLVDEETEDYATEWTPLNEYAGDEDNDVYGTLTTK